jgi:hypothetical protein
MMSAFCSAGTMCDCRPVSQYTANWQRCQDVFGEGILKMMPIAAVPPAYRLRVRAVSRATHPTALA